MVGMLERQDREVFSGVTFTPRPPKDRNGKIINPHSIHVTIPRATICSFLLGKAKDRTVSKNVTLLLSLTLGYATRSFDPSPAFRNRGLEDVVAAVI